MRWAEFRDLEPELAGDAFTSLEDGTHKTIATLRADGSPRISAVEARFVDGDLWFGSMPGSPKSKDLLRDPRFALHSASHEPDGWTGDAKIAGRAIAVHDRAAKDRLVAVAGTAPPGDFDLFRADIDEVVVIRLAAGEDHLLIGRWTAASGLQIIRAGEPVATDDAGAAGT